jgi:hypothetical protein
MPDFVGLTRRSPHRITLRVYGCGSLPAHIRILAMLRIASCSFLARLCRAIAAFASPYHASRVRMRLTARVYRRKAIVGLAHPSGVQPASGMRRTYTIKIHILYKSTRRFALRAPASLQKFAFSRCFASLHAHFCYRRKAIVGLAHPSGVQPASGMRRTYTIKMMLALIICEC